jgi:hypothetical protein
VGETGLFGGKFGKSITKVAIALPKSSFHIYDAIFSYRFRGSLRSQIYYLLYPIEV